MTPETVKIYVNFLGTKHTANGATQHPFITCKPVTLQLSSLRAMHADPATIPHHLGDAMAQQKATDAELCIPRTYLGQKGEGTLFLRTYHETRGRKPKQ